MVLSLVAQHFRDRESTTVDTEQSDIVRGKGKMAYPLFLSKPIVQTHQTHSRAHSYTGKGLIILLHGAPGVGKTTTAG